MPRTQKQIDEIHAGWTLYSRLMGELAYESMRERQAMDELDAIYSGSEDDRIEEEVPLSAQI